MGDLITSIGAIGDGVISIIDFLGKRLLEGITVIRYALDALTTIPGYFTWLPPYLVGIMGTICLIAFLYRILGWGD